MCKDRGIAAGARRRGLAAVAAISADGSVVAAFASACLPAVYAHGTVVSAAGRACACGPLAARLAGM